MNEKQMTREELDCLAREFRYVVTDAICRSGVEYTAEVLPEIPYDRATLNSREARRELTGQILRAFEPVIRKHPEQWFHFVPIWPS